MRKMWRKLFGTAALTFMLCLTGLVMTGEAQALRFVDNGNGTVTDTVTGLMWTKNADMFGRLSWDDAMSSCSSVVPRGWRLPSRDELVALYHAIQGGHPFTGVKSGYWSSTTRTDYPDLAWFVYMNDGNVGNGYKSVTTHAWCVRDGQ